METAENTSKTDKTSGLNKAAHVAHEMIDDATQATYEVANKIVDTGMSLAMWRMRLSIEPQLLHSKRSIR